MSASNYDLKGKRVWVAGHRGMVGSAIARRLDAEQCEIITVGRDAVDLTRQDDVNNWLNAQKPDAVFIAAATVGGIQVNNTRPAEFLYDNLVIDNEHYPCRQNHWCGKTYVFGLSLHLPKARGSTHGGRRPSDRPAGANQ
jgi:GDP-L-fucose synthase